LIGGNSPSGFTGNFLDFHVNGGASVLSVAYNGNLTSIGNLAGSSIFGATFETGSSDPIGFSSNAGTGGARDSIFCRLGAAGTIGVENAATCTNTTAGATGTFVDSGEILIAAAPTVAASQIGLGSTTAAVANCGVTGPTACMVINVAGTTRYVPYY
jgi:hypothetical protein